MAAMPLELWSPQGVLLFSPGMRIARQLGEFYTNSANGTVVIPQLADTANSWFLATVAGGGANAPTIRRNGSTLTWLYTDVPNQVRANMLVLWGVK
ncbi:hypothetical protein ACMU6081_27095 [Achromobacter mucicolens]|uniref:Uncharacterized protein n=2 Tax=Achromobacter mucicolens TaxID=1389922 RepID=A0ABM8LAC8_9BURK|nr:hypothetical protein LMG3415_01581 [Achromobacter mucicolens]